MRSPANRRALELLLRAVAFTGLIWLIAGSFMPHQRAGRVSLAEPSRLTLLRQWSLNPPADSLSVKFSTTPEAPVLDWLVALRRAGTGVTWSGAGLAPLALEVESRADPAGGVLVRAGGAPDRSVALRDRLGALDSLRLGRVGGTAIVPAAEGVIVASVHAESVTAVVPVGSPLHRILVLGAAGWESKFVVTALSERGWVVDARLTVAPRLSVTAGSPAAVDTSAYAAVIALDSTASGQSDAITRYVHAGGGLILGPDAVNLRAFRDLLPAGPGHAVARPSLLVERVTTRADLPIHDLAPLRPNAVSLELADGHLVAAARRVGGGRVLALGLGETWRWRMQGDESALAAHRAWWAANVAAVAYLPVAGGGKPVNPAPLASLYQALGPPGEANEGASPGGSKSWLVLLSVMVSLLGEWTSRRLRGAV